MNHKKTSQAGVVLLVCLGACAQAPVAQPAPAAPAPPRSAFSSSANEVLAAAHTQIQQTLVLTCSSTADCATVGIGARGCGGPEAYLAYNMAATNAQHLRQTAQRYKQLREQQISARGEMSTCEVLPDPGSVCTSSGLCQVLPNRHRQLGLEQR